MNTTSRDLKDMPVIALDGAVGHVVDAYFDEQAWVVRRLAVDTGRWHGGRRIFIRSTAVDAPRPGGGRLLVNLTREQVRQAAVLEARGPAVELRSCDETLGYTILARDGAIGQVQDFAINLADWGVRSIFVATRGFSLSTCAHLVPASIERISSQQRKVYVPLPRNATRHSACDTGQPARKEIRHEAKRA